MSKILVPECEAFVLIDACGDGTVSVGIAFEDAGSMLELTPGQASALAEELLHHAKRAKKHLKKFAAAASLTVEER